MQSSHTEQTFGTCMLSLAATARMVAEPRIPTTFHVWKGRTAGHVHA